MFTFLIGIKYHIKNNIIFLTKLSGKPPSETVEQKSPPDALFFRYRLINEWIFFYGFRDYEHPENICYYSCSIHQVQHDPKIVQKNGEVKIHEFHSMYS